MIALCGLSLAGTEMVREGTFKLFLRILRGKAIGQRRSSEEKNEEKGYQRREENKLKRLSGGNGTSDFVLVWRVSLIATSLEGCREPRHEMTAWPVCERKPHESLAEFAFIAFDRDEIAYSCNNQPCTAIASC